MPAEQEVRDHEMNGGLWIYQGPGRVMPQIVKLAVRRDSRGVLVVKVRVGSDRVWMRFEWWCDGQGSAVPCDRDGRRLDLLAELDRLAG